jgi:hypothetical protein
MSAFSVDHTVGRDIRVSHAGRPLFGYTYAPDTVQLESPKPYLHPIRTLDGDLVSLFRPHDHVWHKGIAWSLPNVGDDNFWGGPTYLRDRGYVQLPNNGTARHRDLTRLDVAADAVSIEHRLDWTTEAGRPVFEETRGLTTRLVGDGTAWALIFETRMTNVSGDTIAIGSPTTAGRDNAGYGGLFWRGPRSFTGGVIHSPAGSGGEELRGTREEWMGFSGQHDQSARWSTLVMVDDRSNPRHPPQWFARTENFACLCPAPFFSEELDVPAGSTLVLRYAVVIADGNADTGRAGALAEAGRAALAATAPVRPPADRAAAGVTA